MLATLPGTEDTVTKQMMKILVLKELVDRAGDTSTCPNIGV